MLERFRTGRDRRTHARVSVLIEALEARCLLTFDPTPAEQYMLELVNRFRINPAAELGLLTSSLGTQARSNDPDIDSALRFFRTNGTVLAQQWAELSAVPPLAWNMDLYEAAEVHNNEMIARDAQEHEFPDGTTLVGRATDAGYTNYRALGESIYAYAKSVLHGHAGFLLDWGNTPTGIQDPPGHRESAISSSFREIGIRITPEANPSTGVGPLVMTLEFGDRFNYGAAALLGVVYTDIDGDSAYDVGEGSGGITVSAQRVGSMIAPTVTTSLSAGGYQLKLTPGSYNVTFSGGAFGAGVTYRDVLVGSQNLKLDAKAGYVPPDPEIELRGGAMFERVIESGDTTPVHADMTYWGDVNLVSSGITRTFLIVNTGTGTLHLTGARVTISTGAPNEFVVTQLPAATIEPGGSAVVGIRFQPVGLGGLRDGTVTVFSDDLDEGQYTFKVRARVVAAPIMTVKGNGATIANGDTSPRAGDLTNFGGTNVVQGTIARVFRLFNVGSAALTVTSITVEGDAGADFGVFPLASTTIGPGAALNFKVRFDPTATGFRFGVVRIVTNDALHSPWTFTIRGNGLAYPEIEVRTHTGVPIVSGSAADAALYTDFGPLAVDNRTLVRMYSVYNLGYRTLNLSGATRVVISGPHAADFTVKTDLPASIEPGASAVFRIRFDPTGAGVRSAIATILSNDPNEGTYTFALTGEGIALAPVQA